MLGAVPIKDLMGKIIIVVDKENKEFSTTSLNEYVNITSRSMFLQLLIVLTKQAEHKLSQFFGDKKGFFLKLKYFFALWALLFFSKVIMLHGANLIFGDKINFYGLFDGLLAFIILIISFLLGEYLLTKIYHALETKNK